MALLNDSNNYIKIENSNQLVNFKFYLSEQDREGEKLYKNKVKFFLDYLNVELENQEKELNKLLTGQTEETIQDFLNNNEEIKIKYDKFNKLNQEFYDIQKYINQSWIEEFPDLDIVLQLGELFFQQSKDEVLNMLKLASPRGIIEAAVNIEVDCSNKSTQEIYEQVKMKKTFGDTKDI